MTIGALYDWVLKGLKTRYDEREAASIASLLMESRLGLSRLDRIVRRDALAGPEQVDRLKADLEALQQDKPVQYVLGEAWFDGLLFKVNEAVLIPRPETEELVHWVVEEINLASQPNSILDVGTGSGCIPIALSRRMRAAGLPVTGFIAIDVSEDALSVAQANAQRLEAPVSFRPLDFLNEDAWASLPDIDILVSNPPYIAEAESKEMHPRVHAHEPHLALFVPDEDPLIFYKKIAKFASSSMKPGSSVYLEINEALGKKTAGVLEAAGLSNIVLRQDMQGKDRMIRARTTTVPGYRPTGQLPH